MSFRNHAGQSGHIDINFVKKSRNFFFIFLDFLKFSSTILIIKDEKKLAKAKTMILCHEDCFRTSRCF